MSSENIVYLHASNNTNDLGRTSLCVSSDAKDNVNEPGKAVDHTEDDIFTMEDLRQPKEENQRAHTTATDLEKDPSAQPPVLELVESVSISQFPEVDPIQCFRNGVKRLQEECNSTESSVRVVYSSLPSCSKRKLEELLSHWSDWHAKHSTASAEDTSDSLESGDKTYFPALHVGSDKPSTVSFSMDDQVWKRQRKESVSLNQECSPLYDRGFAIGLASDAVANEDRGVDLREAPRCFNCGSYNHPLSGCTKPVNKAAVNSARKEFQSKKNHNGSSRVLTRYYQDSPGGKFDGLVPGALSAETRKLMGIGDLDPPPWLNRMRELGYPPGYLDPEEEDQPSGIAIFGDDETQIVDERDDTPLNLQESQKKMMIDFPGINAAIPKNADQSLWAIPRVPAVPDFSHNRPNDRWNFAQDPIAIRNLHGAYGQRNHIDGPSPPFGLGSPRISQYSYNYYPSEPFSPIGLGPSPPFCLGSPPVSQYSHNYDPSEPFSPIGVPIPGSPRYGRPFMHYNHGSF